MKWLVLITALFLSIAPALAQSPGFTGWQSGIVDTPATIMPAPGDGLRNYMTHLYCTALRASTDVELNIKTTRNGTAGTISYGMIKMGQAGDFTFNPPLWGDPNTPITINYKTGGGPAHCTWQGFVGQ